MSLGLTSGFEACDTVSRPLAAQDATMQPLHTAAAWVVAHWPQILAAWPILTAVLTTLWRAIPEATRARWAREHPRLDAAARALRKAGVDLIPLGVELVRVLTGTRLAVPAQAPKAPSVVVTDDDGDAS